MLDALGAELGLDGVGRGRQRGLDVAAREGADLEEVAAVVDRRRALLQRPFRVGDRVERLDLDLDPFGGAPGVVPGVGHHHGEDIADIAGRLAGRDHDRPVVDDEPVAPDARDVVGGQDPLHPRPGFGGAGVDAEHPGARVLRQHQAAVEHSGNLHVGDKVLFAEDLIAAQVARAGAADAVLRRLGREGRSRSGKLDRVDDAVVAGAAAEVAGEGLLHAITVVGEAAIDEMGGPHGDARSAETALDRAGADKALGQELPLVLGKPLEGRDVAAGNLARVEETRQGRFVIEEDGAAAADALRRAAVLDRGDAEVLPQHIEEVLALLDLGADLAAVEGEDKLGHHTIPVGRRQAGCLPHNGVPESRQVVGPSWGRLPACHCGCVPGSTRRRLIRRPRFGWR